MSSKRVKQEQEEAEEEMEGGGEMEEEEEEEEVKPFPKGLQVIYLSNLSQRHNKKPMFELQVKVVALEDLKLIIDKNKTFVSMSLAGRFQDRFGTQVPFECWTTDRKSWKDEVLTSVDVPTVPEVMDSNLVIGQYLQICMFEVTQPSKFHKSRNPQDMVMIKIFANDNEQTMFEAITSLSIQRSFLEPPPPNNDEFISNIADIPRLYSKNQGVDGTFLHMVAVLEKRSEKKYLSLPSYKLKQLNPHWKTLQSDGTLVPYTDTQVNEMSTLTFVDDSETSIDVTIWGSAFNRPDYQVGGVYRLHYVEIVYKTDRPNVFTLKARHIIPVTLPSSEFDEEKEREENNDNEGEQEDDIPPMEPRISDLIEWLTINSHRFQSNEEDDFPSLSDYKRQKQVMDTTTELPIPVPKGDRTFVSHLLELKEEAAYLLKDNQTGKIPHNLSLPKGTYTIHVDVESVLAVTEKDAEKPFVRLHCAKNLEHTRPLWVQRSEHVKCQDCGAQENAEEWLYGIACKLKVSDSSGSTYLHCYNLTGIPALQQTGATTTSTMIQEMLIACRSQTHPEIPPDEPLLPSDFKTYDTEFRLMLQRLMVTVQTQIIEISLSPNLYENLRFYFVCTAEPDFYH